MIPLQIPSFIISLLDHVELLEDVYKRQQKDTSITDAFLSFIEEDSLHHYDALRILEDNHFEKEDCYEIALMKCNCLLYTSSHRLAHKRPVQM